MWLLPSNVDWLKCAHWLNTCGVLPESLRLRLQAHDLKINDFAYALKDGLVLCHLANSLLPGSIDLTEVSRKAHTSQRLCLRNIKQFLNSCKSHFNLNDNDLFQANMLYNLDIKPVIKALSILSRTPIALKSVSTGFIFTDDEGNDGQNEASNDIYYNIAPVEESTYTDETFIFNHNSDRDDDVYQKILDTIPMPDNSKMPSKAQSTHSQKDFVLRELYETEAKFVVSINMILNDFARPFKAHLSDTDFKTIFINMETLKNLHTNMLNKLTEAVKGGRGRTSRVCCVLCDFNEQMMNDYVDYLAGMEQSTNKVNTLRDKNAQFKQLLDKCHRESSIKTGKLNDLIRVPYQRVLKYHLLMRELNKQTEEQHSSKTDIKQTLVAMHDLAQYLNESQRDNEIMDRIEDISHHLIDCQISTTKLIDYGHIIKDDTVRIKSLDLFERIARNRTLFLFDKALLICKSKGDSYSYKETLLIHEYKIEDSPVDTTNSYLFRLCKNDGSRAFVLNFKNEGQKKEWQVRINEAIDKTRPRGYNANNHLFVLTNFDRKIVSCDICKRVLYGIFFQGYKCDNCGVKSHRDCLSKHNSLCCGSKNRASLPLSRINAPTRTPSISVPKNLKAIAIYQYTGRPQPPDTDIVPLKFLPGDIIQVVDDDDDEWWRGVSSNGQEGYFPSAYVKSVEALDSCGYVRRSFDPRTSKNDDRGSNTSLKRVSDEIKQQVESAAWYSDVDRTKSDMILSRISSPADLALFLVRPRQEGGFAISIKFNGTVEHIKIHVSKLMPPQYYLIDQKKFSSIVSLIEYYMKTSLEENFPQLKTTLGTPFREAIPAPISFAKALHDYEPDGNTGVEVELKTGEEVGVLSKEQLGWWKVCNRDGLIGYSPGNYLQELP